jgi:hypothetical protein
MVLSSITMSVLLSRTVRIIIIIIIHSALPSSQKSTGHTNDFLLTTLLKVYNNNNNIIIVITNNTATTFRLMNFLCSNKSKVKLDQCKIKEPEEYSFVA